jgi:hypothetical protein
MGYVGWSNVANLANTTAGGAVDTVAIVNSSTPDGQGVGASGVVVRYVDVPPSQPFIVRISAGIDYIAGDFVLSSTGTAYLVSTSVLTSNGTVYYPI